jgi:CRISPR-associated protein Cmr5
MQTRDQKYAVDAFERVSLIHKKGKDFYDKYGAMAHKLPVLIRTAGLAQALAFVEARGKEPHHRLLSDLAETVGKNNKNDLLSRAQKADLSEYIYLTQQVTTALLWYKRFAQSVLDVDASMEVKTDE